jgi:hypothetical protein
VKLILSEKLVLSSTPKVWKFSTLSLTPWLQSRPLTNLEKRRIKAQQCSD